MTQDEKLKAIIDRIEKSKIEFKPEHISAMVLIGYLEDLAKLGIIESVYTISPVGESVRAICDEFDWKPSDKELFDFAMGMVEKKERAPFIYLIRKYRDDREGLLKELEEFKKEKESPDKE